MKIKEIEWDCLVNYGIFFLIGAFPFFVVFGGVPWLFEKLGW
jgi:hypothetical protein